MKQRHRTTDRTGVSCLLMMLVVIASSALALLPSGGNSGQVLAENALSIVASIESQLVWEGNYSSWTIGDSAYLITGAVTSGGGPVSGVSVVADIVGPNGELYWLRDGTQVLYDTVQGKGMDQSGWISGPTYGGSTNDGIYANFLELNDQYFGNHAGTWTIRLTASKTGYGSASTELTLDIARLTEYTHRFDFIDLDTSTPEEDWEVRASPGQTLNAKLVYDEINVCPAGCVFYMSAWGCPYETWGNSYDIDSGGTSGRSNVERTWTYTVPSTPGIYTMTIANNLAYWWLFYGENVGFVGRLVVEEGIPNNPPNTPSSPSPMNHAPDVSMDADLSWTGGDPDAGDTVTYDVYFGASTSPPRVSNDQAGTTCNPGTLAPSTKYYWKIVATDEHGASIAGPLWDFTTGSAPNNPPNTPSSPSPVNHAPGVSINPNVSWTGGDPDLDDAVTYDVYFGTSSSPPRVSNDQSGTTYNPGTLAPGTKYYWKVVATDNHGSSTTGPLWDLTACTTLDTASLVSPSDDQRDVSTTPTLEWSDVSGAMTYLVEVFYSDVSGGVASLRNTVVDSQWTVSPALSPGTRYEWRVQPTGSCGSGSWSSVWTFFTMCETADIPSLLIPSNGGSASTTPVLDWNDVDGATSYDVQVCTDSGCSDVIRTANVGSSKWTLSLTLSPHTQYWWRVQATSSCGLGSWSSVWTFNTQTPGVPNTPSNQLPANHAAGVSLTDTLQGSAFSDPDDGDSHTASQWQIFAVAGNYSSPVFDSHADTANLTQTTIPSGILDYGSTYYWRLRYQDSDENWSEWSEETQFKTQEPPHNGWRSFVLPGAIVFIGIALLGIILGSRALRMKRNMRRWEDEGYDLSDWK